MVISRNSLLHFKKIKGRIVILEKNKKYLQKLNPAASFIWEMLAAPQTEAQIIDQICQTFETDRAVAAADTADFIKSYLKLGFLISTTLPT